MNKKLDNCDYKKLIIALRKCDENIQKKVIEEYRQL